MKLEADNFYLVEGTLLEKLINRKITGADGEIVAKRDVDGNVTLGFADGKKLHFWIARNGAVAEYEFVGRQV